MAASLLSVRGIMALCFFFLVLKINGFSQDISKYAFTKPTATYNGLATATFPSLTGSNDEGYYNGAGAAGIPIGFDF